MINAKSTADFALRISGSGSATLGTTTAITDAYVPSGASSFGVSDASGFAVGDTVYVQRPVTSAWVAFMGMNDLKTSDGAADTWIAPGTVHQWDRTVTAVSGNQITVDAPISDSIDAKYAQAARMRPDRE